METVTVSKEWYEAALSALDGKYGCPFCGSMKAPSVHAADETFYARKGCLDCNKWGTPFILKE